MSWTPFTPRKTHGVSDADRWMLSFADLLSLMLGFFVLLFSMNAIEQKRWAAMTRALRGDFNIAPIVAPRPSEKDTGESRSVAAHGINVAYLEGVLERKFKRSPEFAGITVSRRNSRLVVSVPSSLMFGKGDAELRAEQATFVAELADNFAYLKNDIAVSAHTDPAPPGFASTYRDNWRLSAERALAVAAALQRAGYRRPIRAFGLADSRFDDINQSLDPDTRYRIANRIELEISPYAGEGKGM